MISDGLACFNAVETANQHHLKIVTGGGAESVELPYFVWVNTMLSNVKNAMHGTYHAIKRKHLPRYLGEFCYKFNRRFDLEKMVDQLLKDCIHTPAMPDRLLKLRISVCPATHFGIIRPLISASSGHLFRYRPASLFFLRFTVFGITVF